MFRHLKPCDPDPSCAKPTIPRAIATTFCAASVEQKRAATDRGKGRGSNYLRIGGYACIGLSL